MTGEAFRRITVLKTMRVHLVSLRPKLESLPMKDYWHLEHAERLVTELLSEPDCLDFNEKALSLYWHIQFCYADYQKFLVDNDLKDDQDVAGEFYNGGIA